MSTLKAFIKLSDRDIIQTLSIKPNYLSIICNIITIENQLIKQDKENELYKFS